MSNGYFISFEGVDGSGKSTQISKLKEYLEESGYDVILSREPGGTRIGEQIRSVILDPANREMTAVTEALLYAASRAQHVHDVIAPAVKEGKIVICDRFVDSSIAVRKRAGRVCARHQWIRHRRLDAGSHFLPQGKAGHRGRTDRIERKRQDRAGRYELS